MKIILRVAGFAVLLMLVILLPIYKMFGIALAFWIAVAAYIFFLAWIYVIYKKLDTAVNCPHCQFKMTYLQAKQDKCPQCGTRFSAKP